MKTSRQAVRTARIAPVYATLILTMALVSTQAFGQSKQYQRKSTKPAPTPGVYHPEDKKESAKTASPAAPADAKSVPEAVAGEKKVDVSDLEKKYWVPKDTEFQVVQNRTYTKANRLAVTAAVGTMINDYYSSGYSYDLIANYYFSERYGVQMQYMRFDSQDSPTVDQFRNTYRNMPDYNRATTYYGAGFNWVPIYAKLSLLEQQIIYFDLSITPGLGVTNYNQMYFYQDSTSKSSPTFSLDIAQHFFLSQHWALRLDFINHWYNQDVVSARYGTSLRTEFFHLMMIQGGITFHF